MINRYIKYYLDFWPVVVPILIVTGIAWGFAENSKNKSIVTVSKENYQIQNQKIDSLNNVIDSLQTELFILEDGCDYREHRYEDALFEYDLGLSYLKEYHPTAYKDFHRIIGMKERYSAELNRENTKRLNQYKTK
jgi:hypothetical protein